MKTVAVNIRLPDDMQKELKKIADSETRTLSNLIKKILLDYLAERKKNSSKSTDKH